MKKIGLFFGLLLLLASCSQDQLSSSSSDVGKSVVRVSLHTSPMKVADANAATRSTVVTDATALEDAVKHVWVFQFQDDLLYSVTGKSVYDVYDIDLTFKDNDEGKTSMIYILANMEKVNTPDTNFPIGMPLADFKAKVSAAVTTEAEFLTNNVADNTIPMCGESSVPIAVTAGALSQTLNINLVRMLARVDVVCNLVAGTSFQLKSVRVCNVPNKFTYYRAINSTDAQPVYGGAEPVITDATTDLFNTPYEAITTTPKTLTFYLPENHRGEGTNSGTDEKLKDGTDMPHATYVEFLGVVNNTVVTYKLYPGANNYNDYNIDRNKQYTLTANFDNGSSSDPRCTMLPKSNCYMITPNGGTVSIPISRANDGPNPTAIPDILAPNCTASILWQTANVADYITIVNPSCNGGYFTVKAPTATPGNALVVIRKNLANGDVNPTGEILWSWHIWVTEPVNTMTIDGISVSTKNAFMDRNLGATTTTVTDVGSFGFLYQWGRKDPQVGARSVTSTNTDFQILYQADGTTEFLSTMNPIKGSVTIAESIANPSCFYQSTINWCTPINTNLWANSKTPYDPCPIGWCVPRTVGGMSPFLGLNNSNFGVDKRFPICGRRSNDGGTLAFMGAYWYTGIINVSDGAYLYFSGSTVTVNAGSPSSRGYSVRCMKE